MIFFTAYMRKVGRLMSDTEAIMQDMSPKEVKNIEPSLVRKFGRILVVFAVMCGKPVWWVIKTFGRLIWRCFWWVIGAILRMRGVKPVPKESIESPKVEGKAAKSPKVSPKGSPKGSPKVSPKGSPKVSPKVSPTRRKVRESRTIHYSESESSDSCGGKRLIRRGVGSTVVTAERVWG